MTRSRIQNTLLIVDYSGALWGLGYFYTVTAGLAVRIGGSGANIDVAVISAIAP
jgi:hypothetical protein